VPRLTLALQPPTLTPKNNSRRDQTAVTAAAGGRVVVEPMAPAEAFPRSFNPLAGAGGLPSLRPGGGADRAGPSSPGADSFASGEEAFGTPRTEASHDSFKSATGGEKSPTEASRSAAAAPPPPAPSSRAGTGTGTGLPAGLASAPSIPRSTHSGGDAASIATSVSRHESAIEFPTAFKPVIKDDASSDGGSAEEEFASPAGSAPPSQSGGAGSKAPSFATARSGATGPSAAGTASVAAASAATAPAALAARPGGSVTGPSAPSAPPSAAGSTKSGRRFGRRR
jgi:hypothetical protein